MASSYWCGDKRLDTAQLKLTEMAAPLLRLGNTLLLCPALLFYQKFGWKQ